MIHPCYAQLKGGPGCSTHKRNFRACGWYPHLSRPHPFHGSQFLGLSRNDLAYTYYGIWIVPQTRMQWNSNNCISLFPSSPYLCLWLLHCSFLSQAFTFFLPTLLKCVTYIHTPFIEKWSCPAHLIDPWKHLRLINGNHVKEPFQFLNYIYHWVITCMKKITKH